MKFAFFLSSILAAVSLVACGGGGSNTPTTTFKADAVDKYAGVWITKCESGGTNPPSSEKTSLTVTKTGSSSASYVTNNLFYPNTACTGSALTTAGETGVVTLVGVKMTTNSIEVDKLDFVIAHPGMPSTTDKDIGFVSGTTLQFGDISSDANGYPIALNDFNVFVKQ
jgi:hypothetical protein